MTGAWRETSTGRKFLLLDPRPVDVCIEDIAHPLSLICRFTGHVREFYSVAQHSILVSYLCNPADAPWGLLHDASEALIGDMPRPLKYNTPVGPPYREIERRIMSVICLRFGLPEEEPESVRQADAAILLAEKAQLLPGPPWPDAEEWKTRCGGLSCPGRIVPAPPAAAERLFLERFRKLFPHYV